MAAEEKDAEAGDGIRLRVSPFPDHRVPAFPVTPAEYLAVVPSFPPLRPSLAGVAPPPDRADELRASRLLTRRTLLEGLSAEPILRSITALQLSTVPVAAKARERGLLMWMFSIACFGATWAFREQYFGNDARNFGVGFGTLMVLVFQLAIVNPSFHAFQKPLLGGGSASLPPKTVSAPTLDSSPLAGLVRWGQLVSENAEGNLLLHDPLDKLCPCTAPGCAGGLIRGTAVLRFLELVFKTFWLVLFSLSLYWTPLVTMAQSIWFTPWSAVLGSLAVVTLSLWIFPNIIARFSGNIPIFRLSERVSHRAMKLALADLLLRLGQGVTKERTPVSNEPYAELHAVFTAVWETRISSFHVSTPVIWASLVALVMAIVNMGACACVPGLYLTYFAYSFFGQMLFDLLALAASNAQVTSIRNLYLEAQREIMELPIPTEQGSAADLRRHEAILGSYADLDRFKGRFIGFVVDYNACRTILVTLVTLIVGVWSILRGLGVTATMDFACPAT
ncbi:hypothetical protein DFJ74DRAFT_691778 [Hyaloraphidium curvatum]|nr:hypothetical protein DFJ74DRAFT_691778 [Hyaloraphidium curvatum]